MAIKDAVSRYNAVVEFTKTVMQPGKDYGVIPGTGTKPTLLKPGAEKLCSLFGMYPLFELSTSIVDFDKGLFYFQYRCTLHRAGMPIATGLGSCNSREEKYRYRQQERTCPNCKKPTIIKGKQEYGGGWICFAKKGGCGAKFSDGDVAIEGQQVGQVENTEPFDLVNTLDKMAQKRALVAATLIAANASEFFTQDVEDMDFIVGEYHDPEPPKITVKEITLFLSGRLLAYLWCKCKEGSSPQDLAPRLALRDGRGNVSAAVLRYERNAEGCADRDALM